MNPRRIVCGLAAFVMLCATFGVVLGIGTHDWEYVALMVGCGVICAGVWVWQRPLAKK